jgi:LmbE family N-acetylglucosaminyl deacetylase
MEKLRLKSGARALVIVAHPDDETIWLGGTLKKFPRVHWTILSLCRASDRDRAPKFKRVCAHFGAKAIIADLDDAGRLSVKQTVPLIKTIIIKEVKGRAFDYLFTHGLNGEYGHPRHCGAHLAVKELLKQKKLRVAQALAFHYKKQTKYKLVPKVESDFILKLSVKELAAKKQVMTAIYGFAPKGIDTNYCTKIEAFKKLTRPSF